MRVIRITVYPPAWATQPDSSSLVILERDLAEPFELAIEKMTDPKMAFVALEVFEMHAMATVLEAGKEGERRQKIRAVIEDHMATFFYWNAHHLKALTEAGALHNPAPAPIPAEDIVYCMKLLARLPTYKNQTVTCSSLIDGKYVQMAEGKPMIAGRSRHHHSSGRVN